MSLLSWLKREGRRRHRRHRKDSRGRKGQRRSPYRTGLVRLKDEIDSVKARLDAQDRQLVDLVERTSDDRLEHAVQDAVQRLHAQGKPILFDRPAIQTVDRPRPVEVERRIDLPSQPADGIRLTPMQLFVLETLAADGGDRYLSYRDVGQLVGKSPGAVKTHINELKKRGVQLEMVMALNNEARYKVSSQLKRILAENRRPNGGIPSSGSASIA